MTIQLSLRQFMITIVCAYFVGALFVGGAMYFFNTISNRETQENYEKTMRYAEVLSGSSLYFNQRATAISAQAMYELEQKNYPMAEKAIYDLLSFNIRQLYNYSEHLGIAKYLEQLQQATCDSPGLKKAIEESQQQK